MITQWPDGRVPAHLAPLSPELREVIKAAAAKKAAEAPPLTPEQVRFLRAMFAGLITTKTKRDGA